MSLPKVNRLSLRQNKDLFSAGQKFYGKYFTFILGSRSDLPTNPVIPGADPESIQVKTPQFAILVSKKTAPKAHDRNKIRRLTVSVIQNLLSQFPIGQYLVIPKKTILTAPFSDLILDLSMIILKLS